jgi:hypothetical protein
MASPRQAGPLEVLAVSGLLPYLELLTWNHPSRIDLASCDTPSI